MCGLQGVRIGLKWASFFVCLGLALPCLAATLRGTLRSVEVDQRRIVVTDKDGDDNHMSVSRTAAISLNGRRAGLADLKVGDRVVVTFSDDPTGGATATAIEASRSPQ